jgi:hypothetical protein
VITRVVAFNAFAWHRPVPICSIERVEGWKIVHQKPNTPYPPPYGCNLEWSKCSSVCCRHFHSSSIASPCTARIWENQNPHCQGCLSSCPSWVPTIQCHLLHFHRQSQQGDAIQIEEPDRSSTRVEALAGHFSFYLSDVSGDLWPLHWHPQEFRHSRLIPVPGHPHSMDCSSSQKLTLMSVASDQALESLN